MPIIEDIVLDASHSVPERSERLTEHLAARPDRGLAEAVACLLATDDERVAQYAADHLALLPGNAVEKTRAAERLRGAGSPVRAAGRLVPWLPAPLLDAFVADYLARPDPRSPLFTVIFEIAAYWPARLRPHREALDQPSLQEGMLSGAPDAWVDELLASWRQEHDDRVLDALARIRTPRAAEALASLRDAVADDERWRTLIAMAGRLPDGGPPSAHWPASMGFVVECGDSPHSMGGPFARQVPACPVCASPSERVLSLAASALPFGLRHDATFFWYTCACQALDFATVQLRPEGNKVFFGPAASSSPGGLLVPGGERALRLEPHPNPIGVSIDASGGFGQHQLGGLPDWIQPAEHPRCPGCSAFMPFIAQIDSGMTLFGRLGHSGVLFGFWCDACAISTMQRQA